LNKSAFRKSEAYDAEMAALKESLPSWRKAAEAHGFGILCIKNADGERFTIAPVDPGRVAELIAKGVKAGVPLSENDVRSQLAQAGFFDADITKGIALAREWATTWTVKSH
jgi:hypothetical protein